jgi:hypothetical protein
VTFLQRFGSALNLNVHFHTLALNGASPYAVGNAAAPRFFPLPPPSRDDPDASPRVPAHAGMSLHADVAVPARDRRRLERLCRYAARPPLANDRLVPLIPPPRAHQVRYHGILAPCASQRSEVVPVTPPGTGPVARNPEATAQDTAAVANGGLTPASCARRTRWAALLQRVFELDALRCPRCGSTLRLLAAIEDPAITRRILECIGLPARAPPTSAPPPSGGPFEPAPSPVEDADFDQTPPYEEP